MQPVEKTTVHAKYNTFTVLCNLLNTLNKPLTCVWWWLLVLHCIDAHHRDAALWWLPLWGLVGLDWIDISCPCGTHRFRRPFIYTSLKYRTSGLNLHELIVLEISRPYIYNGNWEKIHIHLFPIRRLRNI